MSKVAPFLDAHMQLKLMKFMAEVRACVGSPM